MVEGVPLKVVQELLGHASITITLRYAHIGPESRRDAVEILVRKTSLSPVTEAATQLVLSKKLGRKWTVPDPALQFSPSGSNNNPNNFN